MRSLIQQWDDSGWYHNDTGDRLSIFAPAPNGGMQYLSLSVRRVYWANPQAFQLSIEDRPSGFMCEYFYISDWAQFGHVPLKSGQTVMFDRGELVLECVIDECLQEGTAGFNEERESWGAAFAV